MNKILLSAVMLGLCLIALPADAKKRIQYNMKEKVLYGDKTVVQDALQNRGPASTSSKAKATVPDLLKETDSPRYLSGKKKGADCNIRLVGTEYRGTQCSTSFFSF